MRSGRLHFREQHTKQCDTNIRGEKGNNDIPTQYYWVRTTVVQVYNKHFFRGRQRF